MTGAAQRRHDVLERARWRRRLKAAERDREPLQRAMIVGGTVGIVMGVALGQLMWAHELAGPAVAAVLGLGLGVGAGAGASLARQYAVHGRRARKEARERARRREEARRERREKRTPAPAAAVATAAAERADGDFIVPPGFYPDPRGGKHRRWWDGKHWTEKLQPPGET